MILCIIFPVLLIMVHQKPSWIVKAHRPILVPGETCRMCTHFFFKIIIHMKLNLAAGHDT